MPLEDLFAELELSYHIECTCGHCLQNLSGFKPESMNNALTAMVEQIWKDKGISEGTEVTKLFAKQLWGGVLKGYSESFGTVDYDTPDYNMLAALRRNVWQFSAAKNYQQLRALSAELIGEDGKLRSRAEFFKAAEKINDQFNRLFGATEYELAVAGAQMSGKWVEVERQKDIFPYLEFDAVLDGQTTDLCRSLDGVVVPIDHPFVKRYYPPNHFGCRLTIRQRPSGPVTQNLPAPEIPRMFQTNLGQTGLIFPEDHPYFVDIPEAVLNKSMAGLRKELFQEGRERLKGKSVKVPDLGEVTFSSDGLKEIFNQPHAEYMLKNQLATISDLLLQNSQLVQSYPDTKGRGHTYHYLSVKGLQGNYLVVREYADGRKVLYSIIDALK